MRSTVSPSRQVGMPSRGQRAIALTLIVLLFGAFLAHSGYAASSGMTITLGESLTDAQKKELLDYFGATNDDKVQTITVAQTKDAMQGIIDTSTIQSAYSSTALTCRDLGEGLEVKTHNINLITPSLFAMALVTAGIGDAELVVAAPDNYAAQGMTALAGMFQTWGAKPCRSGSTNDTRQHLALQELALTVSIGQALDTANNTTNGVATAGNIVLFTQQAVVINHLTSADDISKAIGDQEAVSVVTVPAALRDQLVNLMVQLAKENIDWSTFSAGWTITSTDDNTGISMKGDGIAIRNAQLTATSVAALNRTATAEAKVAKTATAEAEAAMTQTAEAKDASLSAAAQSTADANATKVAAEATANAQATLDAQASQTAAAADMTSTALAHPTSTSTPLPTATTAPTATPQPTATPAPVAIIGKVIDTKGGQVWVNSGDESVPPVGYTVPVDASISRNGKSASLSDIKKGDSVTLSVDPYTQTVLSMTSTPPATSSFAGIKKFLFLLPALAVIPLIFFIKGRGAMGDPFVVKRVASA